MNWVTMPTSHDNEYGIVGGGESELGDEAILGAVAVNGYECIVCVLAGSRTYVESRSYASQVQ